ncbi:MAG: hypothetical protein QME57_03110, partial [Patescibacteria group bacterium]|nr:hypothetical protein [Patescibacteria group bacterium]
MFLHYQIISLILILFILALSFLIGRKNSELLIISVFTLVIVYGYFFNKSTDKIIQANFAQRKANEALEKLNKRLKEKVDEQTKEIREAYEKVEKAYEIEKKAYQQEKENRQKSEKLAREFERLDRAKTQFLLATQHHLRSPLSIMKNYAS